MSKEDIRKERIKEIEQQIYSMECAYDDLMLNHKGEWDTLHTELRKLHCTN